MTVYATVMTASQWVLLGIEPRTFRSICKRLNHEAILLPLGYCPLLYFNYSDNEQIGWVTYRSTTGFLWDIFSKSLYRKSILDKKFLVGIVSKCVYIVLCVYKWKSSSSSSRDLHSLLSSAQLLHSWRSWAEERRECKSILVHSLMLDNQDFPRFFNECM